MSSPEPFTNTRHSIPVAIGHVMIGGNAPVAVQSMTNTDTADTSATVRQIIELSRAGSELVRITVNTEAAARAVPEIVDKLLQAGEDVPLIGDFHFNGHKLLTKYTECAQALAKYRINPGNVGRGRKRDTQFAAMIETACTHGKPVRIGVNWGSLDGILKLTIYLTDLGHFAAVNQVMTEYFREPFPARATIGVASLPLGVAIEVEAVLGL